jgi:hypothetical protein
MTKNNIPSPKTIEECQGLFLKNNSTFIASTKIPLTNKSEVKFTCNNENCKKEETKRWVYIRTDEPGVIKSKCKNCTRKLGRVQMIENKNIKKKIEFSINTDLEKFCKDCKISHSIEEFETSLKTGISQCIHKKGTKVYLPQSNDDIIQLLYNSNAKLNEDSRKYWKTKDPVKFVCECGNLHQKQVRDIKRGVGAYCKDCTKKQKSEKISKSKKEFYVKEMKEMGKTRIITDPENQKICSECKYVKPKNEFVHKRYDKLEVNSCIECRDRRDPLSKKSRKRKREAIVQNPDKEKKCSACLNIKDINTFQGDNLTCKICRDWDKKKRKVLVEEAKSINSENGENRMCIRCWRIEDKDIFTTKTGYIGSVCGNCRQVALSYRTLYNKEYVKYKIERGPCVDCGETDVRLLDFDHIDPNDKTMNVSQCMSGEQLVVEGSKCEMRCCLCHIRRTKEQFNFGPKNKSDYRSRLEKKQFIQQYKIDIGGCEICEWFDENLLEALHFDHLDRNDKSANVSSMVILSRFSIEDIKEEIELRCRLLCVKCHRLHTFEQANVTIYDDYLNSKNIKII